jgi:hypothetical protein
MIDVRRLWRQPNRWPRLLMLAACMVVLGLYWTNDDMGGDPITPRGDGKYRPVLARGDGHMLYLMARSTALDGDWVFDNDLARFGDPWNEPLTPTGRKGIIHPIGTALVWTPLIWTAEAGAAVANVFGADIPLHGYTAWHQRFVFLSSVAFACGAVLLGLRLARRAIGGTWSPTYAAIAVLLGTSITYYATYMPSYSHAADAFACAAFFAYWAWTIGRDDVRRWLLLGLLLGIATLIRTQELALGIVVAIEVVTRLVSSLRARDFTSARRWLLGGMIALGVTAVVMIPQFVEWHVVFGSSTQLPQGSRYTRFEAPMVMELLFSRRSGWFATTPIAYAGVLGLFCLPRRSRLIAVGLFSAIAIQVYLNSTILDWWGSSSFGQRRLCNVTLPIVVGLAALIWRIARLVTRYWRVPHWLLHAVVIVTLGPCVATNYVHLSELKGGKGADSELLLTCCGNVPKPLRSTAQHIFDRVGNPFTFPANLIFALRHDVPIQRWDQTIGEYPMMPGMSDVRGDLLWQQRGIWRLGSPNRKPFLVSGWSAPFVFKDRLYRITTARSATALVPNLMPYGQRIHLWLAPAGATQVRVRWNGDLIVDVPLPPGWSRISFVLPDIALHTNELTIESDLAPARPVAGWANLMVPVGVAVSDLEFEFLRP